MDIIKFFYFAFFLLFTTRNVVDSSNNNNNNEELNEDNWRGLLENNEWMIEFYAPWCPACNRLKPIWDQFSSKAKELNIKIGAIDLTKYPSLSGLFSVTSLPTIYQYDLIVFFYCLIIMHFLCFKVLKINNIVFMKEIEI